jgi:hypothetical protein
MKGKPTWLKNLFPWEQKTIHVNGRLMGGLLRPFPSGSYQAGALVFPRLVPNWPDHPRAYENRDAIVGLKPTDSICS